MKRLIIHTFMFCLCFCFFFSMLFYSILEKDSALLDSQGNRAPQYIETDSFSQRYLKNMERVAEYIHYSALGYKPQFPANTLSSAFPDNSLSSASSSSQYFKNYRDLEENIFQPFSARDILSSDNFSSLSEQDKLEYYNQKLNNSTTNFFYYVKDQNANTVYYTPQLKNLAKAKKQKVKTYVENLSSRKDASYLVLNTQNGKYISSEVIRPAAHNTKSLDFLVKRLSTGEDGILNSYLVYTFVLNDFPFADEFHSEYIKFTHKNLFLKISQYVIPLSFFLFFILLFLAIKQEGVNKKEKNSTIALNSIDKIPTELSFLLALLLLFASSYACFYFKTTVFKSRILLFRINQFLFYYPIICIFFFSMVRKIKSHTIYTNSLLCRFIHSLKGVFHFLLDNRSLCFKAALIFCAFFSLKAFSMYLFISHQRIIYALLSIFSYAFLGFYLFRVSGELNMLLKEIKKIDNGDLEHQIPEEKLHYPANILGKHINKISQTLSSSIDERVKSERFKAELITNVSHDIKTPLTSIINYVDLLKKEKLDNKTANSYLEVLERKSWRLKTLIEDLVEASKASAGTLKLNITKLNIIELLHQSAGEFEDRFSTKNLEIILNLNTDPIYIMADGRYMYRIIENLFSNVYKYAMPDTRVYVDVKTDINNVSVIIKNISAAKLNISSKELMERFVRGDLARNTEGSGLGLSIAKDLASLQKGRFDILLDGDLFKAKLQFQTVQ